MQKCLKKEGRKESKKQVGMKERRVTTTKGKKKKRGEGLAKSITYLFRYNLFCMFYPIQSNPVFV